MDKRDFYFDEIISQGDMDGIFGWAEEADHALAVDTEMVGIAGGLVASEDAPLSLNVQVTGGAAYDKDGQRIHIAGMTLVDCSKDEYGNDTIVPVGGQERVVSVFVRFKRDLQDPEVDGNSLEVYTKMLESAELFVRMGTPALIGVAIPPALMDDALLVIDLLRKNGQGSFQNADRVFDRREDWYRDNLTHLGVEAFGTPHDAVARLFDLVDLGQSSAGISHAWGASVWADGDAPTSNTVEGALQEIVDDLAAKGAGANTGATRVGAKDVGGMYVNWAGTTVHGALDALATAVNGHIGGGLPKHPATAITTALIGGMPENIGISDVQAVLAAIYGHLNDRTERATEETITKMWTFTCSTAEMDAIIATGGTSAGVAIGGSGINPIGGANSGAGDGGSGVNATGGNAAGAGDGGIGVKGMGGTGTLPGIGVQGTGGIGGGHGVGGFGDGAGSGVGGVGGATGRGGDFSATGNDGCVGITSSSGSDGVSGANNNASDSVGAGVRGVGAHCYGVIAQAGSDDRAPLRVVPYAYGSPPSYPTGQPGDICYNTDTHHFFGYVGGAVPVWIQLDN